MNLETSPLGSNGCPHRNLQTTPDGASSIAGQWFYSPSSHIGVGTLKTSQVPHKDGREAAFAFPSPSQSWLSWVGLAVAVGITYFMAARFGLAFRAKPGGVAVFWPAAGVAIGALIALGPDARLPVAAAVAVATITSKLLITGNFWLGITFGVVCAGQNSPHGLADRALVWSRI